MHTRNCLLCVVVCVSLCVCACVCPPVVHDVESARVTNDAVGGQVCMLKDVDPLGVARDLLGKKEKSYLFPQYSVNLLF